jgi:heme A synthase
MQYLGYVLILVHGFLLLWAVGGFIEMITPSVPWKPFTNPEFPTWVLIIHWSSVLFASVSFLVGYINQWSKTPQIMTIAYVLMALVCVIETFGYMTSKTKYLAMSGEFLAYTVILLLFFKGKYFIEYFR